MAGAGRSDVPRYLAGSVDARGRAMDGIVVCFPREPRTLCSSSNSKNSSKGREAAFRCLVFTARVIVKNYFEGEHIHGVGQHFDFLRERLEFIVVARSLLGGLDLPINRN